MTRAPRSALQAAGMVIGNEEPQVDTSICIVATSFVGTRAALKAASFAAEWRHAEIFVLVTQIGRERLPDAGSIDAVVEGLSTLAHELELEVDIRVCLCADPDQALSYVGPLEGLIVIGGPTGRWWLTPEQRMAERLSRRGHRVIYAIVEAS